MKVFDIYYKIYYSLLQHTLFLNNKINRKEVSNGDYYKQ